MAATDYLFSGEQVDALAKRKKHALTESINRLTKLDTLWDDAARHAQAARIEPCMLDRQSAKFEVDDRTPAVKVLLTIPVSGTFDLLLTRVPRGRGENILVAGEFLNSSYRASERQVGPRVRIVEPVAAGVKPASVREQMKRSVDAIEANLGHINAFVEEHNKSIAAEVERLTVQRSEVLKTGNTLREELGDGI